MPFYIAMGCSCVRVGTVGYFWYQLRSPTPCQRQSAGAAAEAVVAAAETMRR